MPSDTPIVKGVPVAPPAPLDADDRLDLTDAGKAAVAVLYPTPFPLAGDGFEVVTAGLAAHQPRQSAAARAASNCIVTHDLVRVGGAI